MDASTSNLLEAWTELGVSVAAQNPSTAIGSQSKAMLP